MDAVYEELDQAKAEIEKLREKYRAAVELSESLKRAHSNQESKNKETSFKLEKLAQELNDKDDQICTFKQMCDEMKSKLTEKESIVKHLISANEKLRSDCNEKLHKFEEDNRALALALDGANAKNTDQEQKICALKEEVEGVKRLLAFSEKKCSEAESKTKALKELQGREDAFLKLEEEKNKFEDQLKRKSEQFAHLEEAHEKLREKFRMREKEWEEERELALALDEANAKNMDQEKQICALKQEIEGFKRLLSCSEDKCENKSRASKESKGSEDALFKLEEEKRKFEDQLKWKKEQFVHLEEAHQKLRNQFTMKEKEWEKEKASLLDGISSLQTNLESQTRISKDLQCRLEMCNHALAHAEGKRKVLEAQLLEFRTNFDNVCAEYDEAKSNFENLTSRRDQEIASLRSSLSTKGVLYKEMEYQFKKVEQEKQELLDCIKELQEAKIREAGFSSASKLQNKLKSLEQVHKGCSTNLKAKESEWRSEMEKLSEELNLCRSALKSRDSSLTELNRELEACDSLILELELLNQETTLTLLVLKSEFSEAQLRFADDHSCSIVKNKLVEEDIHELVEQLEQKKVALNCVQEDLEEERERVAILSRKVQALEELQFPLQKEVERLKEMLKESTNCQLQSEEQKLQIQSDLKEVNDALDRANEELYEKFCEANEIEFELRMWKSTAEKLESNLEQNHRMRREVEASLLAQVEFELNLKLERESISHQLEEKERKINDLQQKLLEVNESMKDKIEEESLHQLMEEKDQRICDLQQLVASLEQEFESSSTSFSSRLSHMQKETNIFRESWEKVKTNAVLKEVEIQEKNIMITELENDLSNLLQRVQHQKRSLLDSEDKIQEMQVELEKKELEVLHKLESSERTIKKLTENSFNLSSENKNLMNTMAWLSEKMEQLSVEDQELMKSLGKIVEAIDISSDDDDEQEEKENMNISSSSPLMKKVEAIYEERSPLRALTLNN